VAAEVQDVLQEEEPAREAAVRLCPREFQGLLVA